MLLIFCVQLYWKYTNITTMQHADSLENQEDNKQKEENLQILHIN